MLCLLNKKAAESQNSQNRCEALGINSYFKQNYVLRAVEHIPMLHDVKKAQLGKDSLLVTVDDGLLF